MAKKKSQDKDAEPIKDIRYYWNYVRNNRKAAIGTITLAVVISILLGAKDWVGAKTGKVLDSVCAKFGLTVCDEDNRQSDFPWTLKILSAAPHCQTGRLDRKFRDWSPPITWKHGAERLVICTNLQVTALKSEIARKFADRLTECFSLIADDSTVTIETNLTSASVCRAPYRFDGSRTSLAQGLFVCMPGHKRSLVTDVFVEGGNEIPRCDDEILRQYGFL